MVENIRVPRLIIFLCLTFLLSWGFDWLLIEITGLDPYQDLGMNPWGMLAPAFVALLLQMFYYKDSPIHIRIYHDKPRWILVGYLILTLLYGVLVWIAAFAPEQLRIFQGLGALLFTLWTLLLFFISGQGEKGSFARAGLRLGDVNLGVRFIGGIVGFFLLQAGLNLLFGMGDFVGRAERIYGLPIPPRLYIPAIIVLFPAVTVIGIPLSGLAGVFGEEYGWRGFLLSEGSKLGNLPGSILVGLVWALWHFPIILRGVHTYPPSLLSLLLGLVFFVLWGIVQGYAVIKTGSIWVAAFMHGVVNSVYSFGLSYIVRPESTVYTFGLGIYGLLCLGVIVTLLLQDPVWKEKGAGLVYDEGET